MIYSGQNASRKYYITATQLCRRMKRDTTLPALDIFRVLYITSNTPTRIWFIKNHFLKFIKLKVPFNDVIRLLKQIIFLFYLHVIRHFYVIWFSFHLLYMFSKYNLINHNVKCMNNMIYTLNRTNEIHIFINEKNATKSV